jgi:hypothetical protein
MWERSPPTNRSFFEHFFFGKKKCFGAWGETPFEKYNEIINLKTPQRNSLPFVMPTSKFSAPLSEIDEGNKFCT